MEVNVNVREEKLGVHRKYQNKKFSYGKQSSMNYDVNHLVDAYKHQITSSRERRVTVEISNITSMK